MLRHWGEGGVVKPEISADAVGRGELPSTSGYPARLDLVLDGRDRGHESPRLGLGTWPCSTQTIADSFRMTAAAECRRLTISIELPSRESAYKEGMRIMGARHGVVFGLRPAVHRGSMMQLTEGRMNQHAMSFPSDVLARNGQSIHVSPRRPSPPPSPPTPTGLQATFVNHTRTQPNHSQHAQNRQHLLHRGHCRHR